MWISSEWTGFNEQTGPLLGAPLFSHTFGAPFGEQTADGLWGSGSGSEVGGGTELEFEFQLELEVERKRAR